VGRQPVAVDHKMQAVVLHVLAKRDHPGVVEAPGTAVAMKVPAQIEVTK